MIDSYVTTSAPTVQSNESAALMLASFGLCVFPIHTVRDGACSCGGVGCGKSKGKHPVARLAPRGHLDATREPARIRAWWGEMPDAGIGVDLNRSGLIDLAPDSPYWLDVFEARGLPETASYASGGGEGHRHYLYRRPADCPTERLCRTGEFDVLAGGYGIFPPSMHASGARRAWLRPFTGIADLPEAPKWAVDMLKAKGAEREERQRRAAPLQMGNQVGTGENDDEPPVVLSAYGLKLYRGEAARAKDDGDIDRSATLLELGRQLRAGGATRRTIVATLAERDRALGASWPNGPKFAERADATIRYGELAATVLQECLIVHGGTKHGSTPPPASALNNAPVTCPNCERFRRERDEALREREKTSLIIRAMKGPVIDDRAPADERPQPLRVAKRLVNVAIVLDHEAEKATGKADAEGFTPCPAKRLGSYAAASKSTAARYRDEAETDGLIETKVVPIPNDPFCSETWVRLKHPVEDTLRMIADQTAPPNHHGGQRAGAGRKPRCELHPHAKVRRKTTYSCMECGQEIEGATEVEEYTPDAAPVQMGNQVGTGQNDGAPAPSDAVAGAADGRGNQVGTGNTMSNSWSQLERPVARYPKSQIVRRGMADARSRMPAPGYTSRVLEDF